MTEQESEPSELAVDEETLRECQETLGYSFRDPSLLALALTHASCKTEEAPSNERLEYLGDAVLGMVISEHLFHTRPDLTEGDMTQIKSVVVSRPAIAEETERLGLWRFLNVGKGMTTLDKLPVSLLANVFESVTGAIYLDGGLQEARRFVLGSLLDQIEHVEKDRHRKNYKSMLQEFSQREFGALPSYKVLEEEGPDHMKSFLVVAVINGKEYGTSWGHSKKEAERNAAMVTLRQFRDRHEPGSEAHEQ